MNFKKIVSTDTSATTVLVRLIVGAVLLSDGTQKFLWPDNPGAGRLAKIGLLIPAASISLIIIILVAFAITKAEVLANDGTWETTHGSRAYRAMFLGGIFLVTKEWGILEFT